MTAVRTMMLAGVLATELMLSGSVSAQSKAPAPEGFDVIIKKQKAGPKMICMYGKKPCNKDQIEQLAKVAKAKGVDIYMAAPDGSLRCTTRSGITCTEDHAKEIQSTARSLNSN